MSEMGEMFNDLRKMKQAKRADNREQSRRILLERGIKFEDRNGGAHLIIQHNGQAIDFWPGTGKWIVRGRNNKGRGIFHLLQHLGISKEG